MSEPSADNDDFSTLDLSSTQLANLANLGFEKMTPVQARCIPVVLSGKDLIARAKTGSGKTAAFGLGLLERINPRFFGVQALVLCPTRELADQVGRQLRRLAQAIPNIKLVSLCGGKPFGPQKGSLEHGAHIAVGTPGRVLDHLQKKTLRLDGLRTLVLDEADRMLDMGFADDVTAIVAQTPAQRQTILCSATFPQTIRQMSRSIQRDPVTVTVEVEHEHGAIEQSFYLCKKHERNGTLLALLEHFRPGSALVFCHTKIACAQVAEFLRENGVEALAIHGDLDQRERDRVLVQFANNSCPVLVATDVAARGLDIKSLQLVINYELPHDAEIYVHRIGRTGRAGEKGAAVSIFTQAEQVRLNAIETYLSTPCICDVYASLNQGAGVSLQAQMATIEINAGRKHKIRPGDLLGAMTGEAGLAGASVGKIDIFDMCSFVAVERTVVRQALKYFANGKVKGKSVRARRLG